MQAEEPILANAGLPVRQPIPIVVGPRRQPHRVRYHRVDAPKAEVEQVLVEQVLEEYNEHADNISESDLLSIDSAEEVLNEVVENQATDDLQIHAANLKRRKLESDLEFAMKDYNRGKGFEYDRKPEIIPEKVISAFEVPIRKFQMKTFFKGCGAAMLSTYMNFKQTHVSLKIYYLTNVFESLYGNAILVAKFLRSQFYSLVRSRWFTKTIDKVSSFVSGTPILNASVEPVLRQSTVKVEDIREVARLTQRKFFWRSMKDFVFGNALFEQNTPTPKIRIAFTSLEIPISFVVRTCLWLSLAYAGYTIYNSMPRSFEIKILDSVEEAPKIDLNVVDGRTEDLSLMNIRHWNPKLRKVLQTQNVFLALDNIFSNEEYDREYMISYELLTQILSPTNMVLFAKHEDVVKKMCHQASRMNAVNFDRYMHVIEMYYPNTEWVAKCRLRNFEELQSPVVPGF